MMGLRTERNHNLTPVYVMERMESIHFQSLVRLSNFKTTVKKINKHIEYMYH